MVRTKTNIPRKSWSLYYLARHTLNSASLFEKNTFKASLISAIYTDHQIFNRSASGKRTSSTKKMSNAYNIEYYLAHKLSENTSQN